MNAVGWTRRNNEKLVETAHRDNRKMVQSAALARVAGWQEGAIIPYD